MRRLLNGDHINKDLGLPELFEFWRKNHVRPTARSKMDFDFKNNEIISEPLGKLLNTLNNLQVFLKSPFNTLDKKN